MPRFQPPPRRNAACGFPALRAPICFTPRLMGPISLGRLKSEALTSLQIDYAALFIIDFHLQLGDLLP